MQVLEELRQVESYGDTDETDDVEDNGSASGRPAAAPHGALADLLELQHESLGLPVVLGQFLSSELLLTAVGAGSSDVSLAEGSVRIVPGGGSSWPCTLGSGIVEAADSASDTSVPWSPTF